MTSGRTVIVGFETTCDETGCAVVADGRDVLSNIVATQFELHARFGGVVPEIASRAHLEAINTVLAEALEQAGIGPGDVAAVAVAHQPGLIGSLLIGLMAAKTAAWVWDRPLVGVNHIHAHAYAPALDAEPIDYPAVALIASGGHTSLYHVRGPTEMELMGSTIDDAAGEAFDKVAAILGVGFPGGPAIDRAARGGDPKAVKFPRALGKGQSLDFSFSGLKTAVLYHVRGVPGAVREGDQAAGLARAEVRPDAAAGREQNPLEIANVAASFQAAVVDTLTIKLRRAAKLVAARSLIIGGGVAANSALRASVTTLAAKLRAAVRMPAMKYCVDNAAMTAGVAFHHLRAGMTDNLELPAQATVRK